MKYPCLLTKNIKEIAPAKYNPRKISDEAMGRLTKSLAEFGNIQPITWNARTGNVVGGHQRLKVYQAMGKTEVEVWAVDLDEQKEKAANIALNKLAGEFDLPALKDILEDIDTGDLDVEITGFSMQEVENMMTAFQPEEITNPNNLSSPSDLREQFENSSIRQIILVYGTEEYTAAIAALADYAEKNGLANNTEVVNHLLEVNGYAINQRKT